MSSPLNEHHHARLAGQEGNLSTATSLASLRSMPDDDDDSATLLSTNANSEMRERPRHFPRHGPPPPPPPRHRPLPVPVPNNTSSRDGHRVMPSSATVGAVATEHSLSSHTNEAAMRTHHHQPLSAQSNDAGLDDWHKSVDRLAASNYYADKPLPILPPSYTGPPATGTMAPLINFYRRNRRTVLFTGSLFGVGLIFIIIFVVLGHFGIGHGTQNGDEFGKGKFDTGFPGIVLSGKGDGTYMIQKEVLKEATVLVDGFIKR
ncbi:hypothetical protein BDF19DRAFT_413927 [Syncephalis fuscata]|nr:hypothetical protein BDF19DRAFT_413927 [Syncephalis fuscata]